MIEDHDFEMDCPSCGTEVKITLNWEGGDCPNPECDDSYWQEERCTPDFSDCWSEIYWESWHI